MFDAGLYANGLQERVRVVSCALSDGEGMLDFNYQALGSASSASQFGHRRVPGSGDEFVPVASEMVFGSRVDHLVETGVIRAPTLVKIDVDGNELAILRGMTGLLRGRQRQRPRAVQVELKAGEHDAITASCRPDAGRRRSGRSGLHAMHRVEAYGRVVGRTGLVPSTTCAEQVLNVRCEATGTRSRRGCSASR